MSFAAWIFSWLGSWFKWFSQKNACIVLLGLDNAGKTTLLHLLRDGTMKAHAPTMQPTSEEVIVGSIRYKAYDLGGHATARNLWKQYSVKADAVVFLVDVSDSKRFGEAAAELTQLLADKDDIDVPVLVLGNKTDVAPAVNEAALLAALKLRVTGKDNDTLTSDRKVELFMCSLLQRTGYGEGFQWLARYLHE